MTKNSEIKTETEVFETTKGRVLIIAGSDSSGGAGVQADIKTVTALGAYACTAITAVTVQTTQGVHSIHPIPSQIITDQIQAILGDIGADTIKTGMLGGQATIEAVLNGLDFDNTRPLIVDPVMVATSGDRLLDDYGIEAVKSDLLPRATVLTPNAPEASILCGFAVDDIDTQRKAADYLLDLGVRAALVKGGHIKGSQIIDVLGTRKGVRMYTRPRIQTRHTHGTGCTLASAIASLMAMGLSLDQAVENAGDYLHEAIRQAPGLGKGAGPVHHGWTVSTQFATAPVRDGS